MLRFHALPKMKRFIRNEPFLRFASMKRLLYIAFIINSLTVFSQEKKGICSASCHLFHDNGGSYELNDHFSLNGFDLSHPLFYGTFQIDSTTWSDSLIYEITLTSGDSLLFSASWHADGMCYPLSSPEVVDSIVTILEGTSFQIIHTGDFNTVYYSLSQKGTIKDPCLFKIQADYFSGKPYFIRVKFQDPSQSETPLDLPEITNDISMWLSGENTLSVKTDEDAVWEINLYSLSGQLLQKNTLQGSQDLDISKLPKGCYIARFSGENGLKKQVKFIR